MDAINNSMRRHVQLYNDIGQAHETQYVHKLRQNETQRHYDAFQYFMLLMMYANRFAVHYLKCVSTVYDLLQLEYYQPPSFHETSPTFAPPTKTKPASALSRHSVCDISKHMETGTWRPAHGVKMCGEFFAEEILKSSGVYVLRYTTHSHARPLLE